MLAGLIEYFIGLIFGILLIIVLTLLILYIFYCFPLPRNPIIKNQIPIDKDEKEETILWLDSIISNEPIRSLIQNKISSFIQSCISDFSNSSDIQEILRDITVLSTKLPSITTSSVKSFYQDDNAYILNILINLDSPLIVTTSSFVNSLDKEVISDILITQINPKINLIIPFEKGIIQADIDMGVDAEVDIKSSEPIGAGYDVLRGMFIKIMRRLDIVFDSDDDDIFNENPPDDNNNKNFEEEEEDVDNYNNNSHLRYDTSSQTMRSKVELVIPPYPSVSITAVHPGLNSFDRRLSLLRANNRNRINIGPDDNLLRRRRETEKVKLSIDKVKTDFEVKKEDAVNTFHNEQIFQFPVQKDDTDDDDDDDDDEQGSVTSTMRISRKFTI